MTNLFPEEKVVTAAMIMPAVMVMVMVNDKGDKYGQSTEM